MAAIVTPSPGTVTAGGHRDYHPAATRKVARAGADREEPAVGQGTAGAIVTREEQCSGTGP